MKLKFSISPATCILLFCMIATTPLQSLTACLSAAAIHELGHIAAAKLLSINLSELRLDVLGARLGTCGRLCSYPALIALCIAGPAINFLCFVIALPFCNRVEWLHEFGLSSLSLGLMNLIPVEGFDGGRILHGLLCKFLQPDWAERICRILSFCSILLLWMLSVWLLLRTGSSLTLFVFSCLLFGMLFV
jgi:stage IV sporulation protein FB